MKLGCSYGSWGCLILSRSMVYLTTPYFKFELRMKRKTERAVRREYICSECGEGHSAQFPDACLGHIAGVRGACCGHGISDEAYIAWESGLRIRGFTVDRPHE